MINNPTSLPSSEPVLELKSLTIFLAVAETGSMTAAGRRLELSQPAVSQAMARLEAKIGAHLFERDIRPLRLTPAGEMLRDGGPKLLEDEEALRRRVINIAEVEPSAIRLGLVDSFAATAGPKLIRALRGYTEHISVWSGITSNLWDDLQDRRLDYMVSTETETLPRGGRRQELMTEPFFLLLPKRLALNIEKPSLRDLAHNHPFVRYSIRSRFGAQIESYLKSQKIEPQATMEFDSTDAVYAMISAGLGWAITTPLCLLHGRAYTDDLVPYALSGKPFTRTLYLISGPGAVEATEQRIVREARDVLAALIKDGIRPLIPWAADAMTVHD
jgi:DNA-binding transcriptional LysR family regulator